MKAKVQNWIKWSWRVSETETIKKHNYPFHNSVENSRQFAVSLQALFISSVILQCNRWTHGNTITKAGKTDQRMQKKDQSSQRAHTHTHTHTHTIWLFSILLVKYHLVIMPLKAQYSNCQEHISTVLRTRRQVSHGMVYGHKSSSCRHTNTFEYILVNTHTETCTPVYVH